MSSPVITLANGVQMPQLGFGVFRMKEYREAYEATLAALNVGYRAIDTAAIYGNEEAVGQAIKDSGIAREDVFITTKVWNADQGFDNTLRAFEVSLKKLDLEYVDVYLTHWPKPQLVETYKAIEQLYEQKLVRAPGVSNHHQHHLEQVLAVANVAPMVNQIECHPSLSQDALRAFCYEKKIAITSWAPLGTGITFTHPIIEQLATKYAKTAAQIVLRWHIELGNIAIPKSANPSRMAENLHIFDFTLQTDEIAAITALNTFHRTGADPDNFDF